MAKISIKKVETKREMDAFVRFSRKLYAGNPYYVPDLESDIYNTFNPARNAGLEFTDIQPFLAYDEQGEVVGRIVGIINHHANEKWHTRNVRFGFIEFVDNPEVSAALLSAVEEYRAAHPLDAALRPRIPAPAFTYYGKEVWEQALAALLCGENLLLAGGKATGKNVLAENLSAAFGRPAWDISFHVNMDAASLIGMDTFVDGAVTFRPGPVYRCAQCGGFGVLDEINMAKNEALAVLHAVLDFRRAIDVPGYERIPLAEETRFIATMNYGYAGTRELNEALTSRFAVIQMPTITEENLEKLLRAQFADLTDKYVHQFALLFLDLQKKCDSAEISTKALDLRGMLDALRLMRRGVAAGAALDMGITNKAFDSYEQGLIRDAIAARIPAQLTAAKLFD